MDPFFLPAILGQATPIIALITVFGSPLALFYMVRSFRLREKELDLKRAQAARHREDEIAALEERVARLESDRAFFERLADRSLRAGEIAAFGARARVPDAVGAVITVDPSPELEGVAFRAPRSAAMR